MLNIINTGSELAFPALVANGEESRSRLQEIITSFFHYCRTMADRSANENGWQKSRVIHLDLRAHNIEVKIPDISMTQAGQIKVAKFARQSWQGIGLTFTLFIKGSDNSMHLSKIEFLASRHEMLCHFGYFLSAENVQPQISIPYGYFNGNQVEILRCFENSEVLSSEYWDEWHEVAIEAKETYKNSIHKLFCQATRWVCQQREDLVIIDVGGGDGSLAFNNENDRIKAIYVLDNSKKSIGIAQQRVGANAKSKVIPIVVDIRDCDYSEVIENQKADIIYLSGVVADEVLNRTDSIRVVQNCYKALKRGGYLFVASYSAPQLHSADYKKLGFIVKNKVASYIEMEKLRSQEFYILKKELL